MKRSRLWFTLPLAVVVSYYAAVQVDNLVHAQIGVPAGVFYAADEAAAATWMIPGIASHLQSCAVTVTVWDSTVIPWVHVEPDSITCDPAVFDITVNFAVPQAGKVVVIP